MLGGRGQLGSWLGPEVGEGGERRKKEKLGLEQ